MKNVSKPFSFASLMRLPFSWSVTAMTCLAQPSPTFALSASVMMRYWLIVSAVAPDLVMMQKQVFSSSMTSNSAAMRSGSMLSST